MGLDLLVCVWVGGLQKAGNSPGPKLMGRLWKGPDAKKGKEGCDPPHIPVSLPLSRIELTHIPKK